MPDHGDPLWAVAAIVAGVLAAICVAFRLSVAMSVYRRRAEAARRRESDQKSPVE